jgi:drug/metabolite transporter (DMT)-like permease
MLKFIDRDYLKGFALVFSAGTIWSFGALLVRYMQAAQTYRWQYLFFRGLTIVVVLLIYLLASEGAAAVTQFKRTGLSGVLGACGLVAAFSAYIWSITLTTVANTLCMLAAGPFIAAFLGIMLLKERIRYQTWVAMAVALVGILVMVLEGLEAGNLFGNLIALVAALGMAVFAVSLRWRKETPQFTTVALGGVLCALFALVLLYLNGKTPMMPLRNVYLSAAHGIIIGVGLILFSVGAKFLPAAELTLLSLVEVVWSILWVYLPVLGVHEIPSMLTIMGGAILFSAIAFDGVSARQKRRIIKISQDVY